MSEFEFTQEINLYVIVADPKRHGAHSLHTLTAPFVLTTEPQPGDMIHAVIKGMKLKRGSSDETGTRFRSVGVSFYSRGKLKGHAGRSARLGEDSLETRDDALAELVPELLGERSWRYAPMDWEPSERLITRSWTLEDDRWIEVR
jgi:hypothetical protein